MDANADMSHRLSFLDRTNIGNARLAGLETDLKMKGLDYNVSVSPLPILTTNLTLNDVDCLGRLLPLVRCCGDSKQHHDEAHEPFIMACHYYARLGHL